MKIKLLLTLTLSLLFSSLSSAGGATAPQRIDSQNDVWCSSPTCSTAAQTNPLNVNLAPGNWVNNVRQLNVPGGNGNGEITFVSQDESVCRVDANGKVTRVAPGNCVITVTKGVDIEFAAWSEDFSFNIGCDQPPALTIIAANQWNAQDQMQLNLGGGVGNGHVMWMTNDENICTVADNGMVTQHAKGNCTVTAMKEGDNTNFTCGASGTATFATAVFDSIKIVNGLNCGAGWTNPTSAVLEAALARGSLNGQAGLRAWYYCINGYGSFVNTADGAYIYYYPNGGRWVCPGARSQPFKTSYPWSKSGRRKTSPSRQGCSSCGSVSAICLK